MTIQTINLGNYANDGTGDDLRTAFEKVNANFALLEADVTGATNLGAGVAVFAQKNSTNLEFKTLTSVDNSVAITHNATTINLAATPSIVVDTNPQLGGNLDLQDHYLFNGDARTTVYGFDVPGLAAIIQLMIESNQLDLEMGGWDNPSTANLDFNGTGNVNFIDSATSQLNIDLGTF